MAARRPLTVSVSCRRGCGRSLVTTRRPIGPAGPVATDRWERLHGICETCLTNAERTELLLPPRPDGSVGGLRTWSVYARGIGRVGTVRAVTIQDAEREGAAAFAIPRADVHVTAYI